MTGPRAPGWPPDHGERPRRLQRDELLADPASAAEVAEAKEALEAAQVLESITTVPGLPPSREFAERVMAAVSAEPAPGRRGFLVPLRRSGLAGLGASLRQAWAVAQGASRPLAVRATALAYVLAIALVGASLTGLAGYGFAGALGLLDGDRTPAPALPSPTPPLDQASPSLRPSPSSPAPEPTESAAPSPSPSATPDESFEPPESEDPDDDSAAGVAPAPTASDDDDIKTPKPSDTPRPTRTPDPSKTPDSA